MPVLFSTERPVLAFSEITLADKTSLDPILKRYGENSCQHSFSAMYCQKDKYNDEFALSDGSLFIHRAGLDNDEYRTYLAPMGDADLEEAMAILTADAHAFGKKLRLESVTAAFADKLKAICPEQFAFEESRDLGEYLYTFENLSTLPGHPHSPKRTGIERFWDIYGPETTIEAIGEDNVEDILAFQRQWIAERTDESGRAYFLHEYRVIERALSALNELEISGIVIRYRQAICGYALGFPLSDDCFDEFIEKGDRHVENIYRVLNQEFVKRCCAGYAYINREEDLGVPGLRQAKKSYQPCGLLEKFVIAEV